MRLATFGHFIGIATEIVLDLAQCENTIMEREKYASISPKKISAISKSWRNLVYFRMSCREAFLLVTTEVVATLFRFYWATSQNELIKPILLHPTMTHCRLLWEIWACIVFPYNYWLHSLTVSSFFYVLKECWPGNALNWLLLTYLQRKNNSLKSA